MPLTTTSYAILGLLDLRDWSAYELAQQADRSLAFTWPVSQSQLYAEPKRLEREGLIRIETLPSGPVMQRQVFAITAAGRRSLRAWLATEPAAPVFRVETLLRCLLATSGTQSDLLTAIAATRDACTAMYAEGAAITRTLLDPDAPFPERTHVNLLWMELVGSLLTTVVTWADAAQAEVSAWPDLATPPDPVATRARLRAMLDAQPAR